MIKNVGIIMESFKGEIKSASFGMITMAGDAGNDLSLIAFVMDADAKSVKKELELYGITKIVHVCLTPGYQKNPDVRARSLMAAIKEYDIHALFGLSTSLGKDILPRVASLINAPLVMDCQSVDLENRLAVTSQYSGKTIAWIKVEGNVPVLGVRPNSIEPLKRTSFAEIMQFDATKILPRGLKVVEAKEPEKRSTINLVEAKLIIAGGRGLKSKENFALVSRCAEKLNAGSGASRVAVDAGWVPYCMQVGQTGEKVSPAVYIAFGISGSVQHFAGMKISGMIISVNTDENAAIISNSDYFAVADAVETLTELTRLLENE